MEINYCAYVDGNYYYNVFRYSFSLSTPNRIVDLIVRFSGRLFTEAAR